MDAKLELVPVPVTDVDRALRFYVDALGFTVDVDMKPTPSARFVQLTPPGSACSIALTQGIGMLEGAPGSLRGIHLVVADIHATRAGLLERGVEVGQIDDVGGGVLLAGLADPDGNRWILQEMPWRTGDRY